MAVRALRPAIAVRAVRDIRAARAVMAVRVARGLLGLSGKPHPALQGISETREAVKFRAHIQLLSGDFPSFEKLGSWHNAEPHCRLCPAPVESTQHILTECKATADVRHDCFLNY